MTDVNRLRKIATDFTRALFVSGNGDEASRLVLMDETYGKPGKDLGGLCEAAIRERLFRMLCDEMSHE